MKKLVTILALTATVIASPAFAKTPSKTAEHARAHVQSSDTDMETYTFDGKVVSQDPDPFIRQQALRGAESGGANR